MKKFLIFDVETSGFTPPKARIAELAFMLVDESGNELHSHSSLIKPDGWEIPKEKFFIDNGMSTERNIELGVPIFGVLREFQDTLKQCDYVVAHNIPFDRKFVMHELKQAKITHQLFQFKKGICTMSTTTDYCKLPGKYGNYKWPKLEELHHILFEEGFDGAHEALADVKATSRCLIELIKRGIIKI